jgi:hypothetical protein
LIRTEAAVCVLKLEVHIFMLKGTSKLKYVSIVFVLSRHTFSPFVMQYNTIIDEFVVQRPSVLYVVKFDNKVLTICSAVQ